MYKIFVEKTRTKKKNKTPFCDLLFGIIVNCEIIFTSVFEFAGGNFILVFIFLPSGLWNFCLTGR